MRGHKFAKWGKVDSFTEALCWMVLKGGGKGVKGQTFKPFDLLQFAADVSEVEYSGSDAANVSEVEGSGSDTGSDSEVDGSGSEADGDSDSADFAKLQRSLENITLADCQPRTFSHTRIAPASRAPGKQSAPRETAHSPAVLEDLRKAPNRDIRQKGMRYPWLAKGGMNPVGASWMDVGT